MKIAVKSLSCQVCSTEIPKGGVFYIGRTEIISGSDGYIPDEEESADRIIEKALEVLRSRSVESKLWSEAAKWILLYGPPELQKIMRQASDIALKSCFPDLEAERYTEKGDPCYDIAKIAEALGITREEALKKMAEMEFEQGIRHIFDASETDNIQ